MSHTAKLLNRNRGRFKVGNAWGALGGAKVRPLVFRQGGAADRLFRASFAGTVLSGGRPSPKEAGKASRPLRGKRDP